MFFNGYDETHGLCAVDYALGAGFIQVCGELWVSDGTPEGTDRIDVIPGIVPSAPEQLFGSTRGMLYFLGRKDGVGPQLWISDGTLAGTRPFLTVSNLSWVNALATVNTRGWSSSTRPTAASGVTAHGRWKRTRCDERTDKRGRA